MSLYLKWVTFGQQIKLNLTFLFIQTGYLCMLIHMFRQFTFNVIIDIAVLKFTNLAGFKIFSVFCFLLHCVFFTIILFLLFVY